jgi:hypothetical protein
MLNEREVESIVDCHPYAVCECGGQVEVRGEPRRHQVFEVPPMRAQVDEYRPLRGLRQAPRRRIAKRRAQGGIGAARAGTGRGAGHALPPHAAQDSPSARSTAGAELQR